MISRAMVQEAAQGIPSVYAREMERLSAKESLILAVKSLPLDLPFQYLEFESCLLSFLVIGFIPFESLYFYLLCFKKKKKIYSLDLTVQ